MSTSNQQFPTTQQEKRPRMVRAHSLPVMEEDKRNLLKKFVKDSQRLKQQSIEFVDLNSKLLKSSRRLVSLSKEEEHNEPQVKRLKGYIELHKESSEHHIFEVGYSLQDPSSAEKKKRVLCIGCTKCSHRIFPNNKLLIAAETDFDLEDEARVLADMEEHVTKHYMNTAKLFLWLLEAFFKMVVNYYDQ